MSGGKGLDNPTVQARLDEVTRDLGPVVRNIKAARRANERR
jgi:hypothetical protein